MGVQDNSREPALSSNGDQQPAAPSDYDPLLPVQYYERVAVGRTPSGELKLFFAILEDALRCYVRAKNCRSGAKRAEFVDARIWFHTRGTPHVFSFESVCLFLAKLESLGPTDLPLKQFRTRRRLPARPSAHRTGRRHGQSTTISANGHEASGSDPASSGGPERESNRSHASR